MNAVPVNSSCDQCFAIHVYLDCLRNDMKCPLCGRIWRVPGPAPIPERVPQPQLIYTPPFTTPTHESNDPGSSSRVSVLPSTSALSAASRRLESQSNKITQVYVCPNIWCDYMIHTTHTRSIPQCFKILDDHRDLCDQFNGAIIEIPIEEEIKEENPDS